MDLKPDTCYFLNLTNLTEIGNNFSNKILKYKINTIFKNLIEDLIKLIKENIHEQECEPNINSLIDNYILRNFINIQDTINLFYKNVFDNKILFLIFKLKHKFRKNINILKLLNDVNLLYLNSDDITDSNLHRRVTNKLSIILENLLIESYTLTIIITRLEQINEILNLQILTIIFTELDIIITQITITNPIFLSEIHNFNFVANIEKYFLINDSDKKILVLLIKNNLNSVNFIDIFVINFANSTYKINDGEIINIINSKANLDELKLICRGYQIPLILYHFLNNSLLDNFNNKAELCSIDKLTDTKTINTINFSKKILKYFYNLISYDSSLIYIMFKYYIIDEIKNEIKKNFNSNLELKKSKIILCTSFDLILSPIKKIYYQADNNINILLDNLIRDYPTIDNIFIIKLSNLLYFDSLKEYKLIKNIKIFKKKNIYISDKYKLLNLKNTYNTKELNNKIINHISIMSQNSFLFKFELFHTYLLNEVKKNINILKIDSLNGYIIVATTLKLFLTKKKLFYNNISNYYHAEANLLKNYRKKIDNIYIFKFLYNKEDIINLLNKKINQLEFNNKLVVQCGIPCQSCLKKLKEKNIKNILFSNDNNKIIKLNENVETTYMTPGDIFINYEYLYKDFE